MSTCNKLTFDDQCQAENRLDLYVNSLNSMRDGSSNPEKVRHKIRQIISEIDFIRSEFPDSESCYLKNVLFGGDVVDTYQELRIYL